MVNQPVDAIGSVANYFVKNGWKTGEPVTSKPYVQVSDSIAELANRKRKTKYQASELRSKGASISASIADTEKLNVLMLNASEIVPKSTKSNHYIVRAGDTICQIAEAKNVPCKELFKLNKLNARGDIFRGQRLKLPAKKIVSKSSESASSRPQSGKWTVGSSTSPKTIEQEVPEDSFMPRYFYTHRNFYAITQYNHSVLYAMAVHDLSVAIDQAKQRAESINASVN